MELPGHNSMRELAAAYIGKPRSELRLLWTIDSLSSEICAFADLDVNPPISPIIAKKAKSEINGVRGLLCPAGRGFNEYQWLHTAYLIDSSFVVRPLHYSEHEGVLFLEYLGGADTINLRYLIMSDSINPDTVAEIIRRYLKIQRTLSSCWSDEISFRGERLILFFFRIRPHLFPIYRKFKEVRDIITEVANDMIDRGDVVIHGDFSPKNILAPPGRFVLLDAESAGFGPWNFDIMFFLSQALLEVVNANVSHLKCWSTGMQDLATTIDYYEQFYSGYEPNSSRMLALLMLARLEGLSRPAEYKQLRFPKGINKFLINEIKANNHLKIFLNNYFGMLNK